MNDSNTKCTAMSSKHFVTTCIFTQSPASHHCYWNTTSLSSHHVIFKQTVSC